MTNANERHPYGAIFTHGKSEMTTVSRSQVATARDAGDGLAVGRQVFRSHLVQTSEHLDANSEPNPVDNVQPVRLTLLKPGHLLVMRPWFIYLSACLQAVSWNCASHCIDCSSHSNLQCTFWITNSNGIFAAGTVDWFIWKYIQYFNLTKRKPLLARHL